MMSQHESDRNPSPYRPSFMPGAEKNRRDQRWALLGLLLVLAAVAIVGVAIYDPAGRNFLNWRTLGMMMKPQSGFEMGKTTFGMTPAMVRRQHPDAEASEDAFGRLVVSYSYDGAHYEVWFLDQANRQKAYRIRYRHTLHDTREDDVLALMGKRFGRPNTADCTTHIINDVRDCAYTWRVAEIKVAANIQTPPLTVPEATLALTLTAEHVTIAAQAKEQP